MQIQLWPPVTQVSYGNRQSVHSAPTLLPIYIVLLFPSLSSCIYRCIYWYLFLNIHYYITVFSYSCTVVSILSSTVIFTYVSSSSKMSRDSSSIKIEVYSTCRLLKSVLFIYECAGILLTSVYITQQVLATSTLVAT